MWLAGIIEPFYRSTPEPSELPAPIKSLRMSDHLTVTLISYTAYLVTRSLEVKLSNYNHILKPQLPSNKRFLTKMSPPVPYPTKPAFIVYARGWDSNLLKHPMLKFLHAHEILFDAKDFAATQPYYTTDIIYIKSNGERFDGIDAAVAGMAAEYSIFSEYFHEPVYGTVIDTEDGKGTKGHRLFGTAKLFGNLAGPFPGEGKFRDLRGRNWECVTQGGFIFDVIKDETGPGGYRLKFFQVMSDPTPILKEAVKRGIVPIEALLN